MYNAIPEPVNPGSPTSQLWIPSASKHNRRNIIHIMTDELDYSLTSTDQRQKTATYEWDCNVLPIRNEWRATVLYWDQCIDHLITSPAITITI